MVDSIYGYGFFEPFAALMNLIPITAAVESAVNVTTLTWQQKTPRIEFKRHLCESGEGASPRWWVGDFESGGSDGSSDGLESMIKNGCFSKCIFYCLGGGLNIFYFYPYLGKMSNLTHIFGMGWFNHQLVVDLDI